ncbi:MAG: hypothetical protein ACRDRP_06175 [Pseudonocardiaceae bacterium]
MTATDDHAHRIQPQPGARADLEETLRREGVQPIQSADDLFCDGIFDTDEELDQLLFKRRADTETALQVR